MDKRAYKNGITRCGAHDKYAEQQTCDDFLKATYHNRCMFCISGDICDWNPDMACVVKKEIPARGRGRPFQIEPLAVKRTIG